MKGLLKRLAATPGLGRALLVPYRLAGALPYVARPVSHLARWLITSREYTNYSYDLTDLNVRYLTAFVSQVSGVSRAEAAAYINEIESAGHLAEHIRQMVHASDRGRFADVRQGFGRRIGWYAMVRAVKPRVVVETGVDTGLGACVVTEALRRNASEGWDGYYYGTDINPEAGYLLAGEYARYGEILYGDSIDSLETLDAVVDMFINDSDHAADYEGREYEAIREKLSPGALVLSDNAHCTDRLLDFADRTGRWFLFFQEQPRDHWYPGAGIGVAYGGKAGT
jgi:hypothetical protein